MGWFKRSKGGISTPTQDKKETPEGLWHKCPSCNHVVTSEDHDRNIWVCEECQYHDRIGSEQYFSILFDDNKYTEINADMVSGDPLKFEDTKKYTDRIAASTKKTGLIGQRTGRGDIGRFFRLQIHGHTRFAA